MAQTEQHSLQARTRYMWTTCHTVDPDDFSASLSYLHSRARQVVPQAAGTDAQKLLQLFHIILSL